jgi:hypothetical protein
MPVNQRKKVDISECAHAEVAKVQILKYLADHFLLPSVASNLVATHVQLERRERLHLGQEIEESCSGYCKLSMYSCYCLYPEILSGRLNVGVVELQRLE